MAKNTRKTGSRAAAKTPPGKALKAATKRPGAAAAATEERIARALEAIAAGMATTSPQASNSAALNAADAFVWHPDGRLAPVPRSAASICPCSRASTGCATS